MAYGFKLTGVTIPENTTAINAVISDGTTPSEYTLTGDITNGFSGTDISATCTGIATDAQTIVDTSVTLEIDWQDCPVTFPDGTNFDNKPLWLVTIGGHECEYVSADGSFEYYDSADTHNDYVLFETDGTWYVNVVDGSEQPIPGTYTVKVSMPTKFDVDVTVDAYTSEDEGDEYNLNLSTSGVTEAFREAVDSVVGGNGGNAPITVYFEGIDYDGAPVQFFTGYKDANLTQTFEMPEVQGKEFRIVSSSGMTYIPSSYTSQFDAQAMIIVAKDDGSVISGNITIVGLG